jgi:hypothetical protein
MKSKVKVVSSLVSGNKSIFKHLVREKAGCCLRGFLLKRRIDRPGHAAGRPSPFTHAEGIISLAKELGVPTMGDRFHYGM